MTFGLRNAGQTLQRYLHAIFGDLSFVFPYIDDLCIASSSVEEHKKHLETVFKRLRENGLAINAEKWQIGKSSVIFLGHVITPQGIKPNPAKVQAIIDFPRPKVAKQLKTFLGTINFYRRFIPHAAKNQTTLQTMITGNVRNDNTPLVWDQQKNDAFENCSLAHNQFTFGSIGSLPNIAVVTLRLIYYTYLQFTHKTHTTILA